MPRMIWVPNAEWMAIEAARRASALADLSGEEDQHRDHDPRPPAVHEVEQEEVVGHREAERRATSRCPRGRNGRSCRGQVLET